MKIKKKTSIEKKDRDLIADRIHRKMIIMDLNRRLFGLENKNSNSQDFFSSEDKLLSYIQMNKDKYVHVLSTKNKDS